MLLEKIMFNELEIILYKEVVAGGSEENLEKYQSD
jgi:hypothetical protein